MQNIGQQRKEVRRHVTSVEFGETDFERRTLGFLVMMQNGQIRVNKGRLILISLVNTLNLMHNNLY